jgi:hypothetical protein
VPEVELRAGPIEYILIPEDQPVAFARAIRDFVGATA